jgi:hypothetical protein
MHGSKGRGLSCLGEIASGKIIEAAQANNMDNAMRGIHLPELARRDTPLKQRFNPGVEGRHSEIAKVLAVLNAFKHEDSGRQRFPCHRGE